MSSSNELKVTEPKNRKEETITSDPKAPQNGQIRKYYQTELNEWYSYKPLSDPRNIRLLCIQRGEGAIHVHLRETTMDLESYDAFSYTWGSPIYENVDWRKSGRGWGGSDPFLEIKARLKGNPHRFIYCNSKKLEVTENLYQALLQFRLEGHIQSFWVDAICINQKSAEERTSQVQMMGDIYATSNAVITWLGIADSDTESVVDLISMVGKAIDDHFVTLREGYFEFNSPSFYQITGLRPLDDLHWKMIAKLFSRRWFCRQWVLQEITLGNPVAVMIGPYVLDFKRLQAVGVFLTENNWTDHLTNKYNIFIPVLNGEIIDPGSGAVILSNAVWYSEFRENGVVNVPHLKNYLQRIYKSSTSEERFYEFLQDLLAATSYLLAEDPRDYIFAPLAIVGRYFISESLVGETITTDYSQDAVTIYTTISSRFLRQTPLLSLISEVKNGIKNDMPGIPSWVPNFSYRLSGSSLMGWTDYDVFKGMNFIDDRLQRLDSCAAPTHLRVFALLNSTIHCIAASSIDDMLVNSPALDYILEFASRLPVSSTSKIDRLWQTLVADSERKLTTVTEREGGGAYYYTTPASKELGTCFITYLYQKIAASLVSARREGIEDTTFWQKNAAYESLAKNKEVFDRERIAQMADEQATDSSEFVPAQLLPLPYRLLHILDVFEHRRLYITTSGHLGLCLASSQPGDVVAFIRNCRIPMIVRKATSGNYTLIGETYIHGHMHGEILKHGSPEFQQIIIE